MPAAIGWAETRMSDAVEKPERGRAMQMFCASMTNAK